MKLEICICGDRSVGIHESYVVVDFGEWQADEVERRYIKEKYVQLTGELFDAPCYGWYDDECSDCGKLLATDDANKGSCTNPNCISNLSVGD